MDLFQADAETAAKLLADGADPNQENNVKKTPLFGADLAKTNILLQYHANPNHLNRYGDPPLFFTKDVKVATALLAAGANPNHANQSGLSLLMFQKDAEIASALISYGANVNHVEYKGSTALFYAKNAQMASVLLAAGANPNHTDHNHCTPIFQASFDAVPILVAKGANPNHTTDFGRNALWYTTDPQKMEALLKVGVDPNRADNHGQIALESINNAMLIGILLDHGSRINIPNIKLKIQCLIEEDDVQHFELLVHRGVEIDDDLTRLCIQRGGEFIRVLLDTGMDPEDPLFEGVQNEWLDKARAHYMFHKAKYTKDQHESRISVVVPNHTVENRVVEGVLERISADHSPELRQAYRRLDNIERFLMQLNV